MTNSGPEWCKLFPTSNALADLAPSFRPKATAFVTMLAEAGAFCSISATLRPAFRAWLMHYSWCIAREGLDPATVPAKEGLDIVWDHPDAKAAAEEMVEVYRIVRKPVLDSEHIRGTAIDMTIHVPDGSLLKDRAGTVFSFHGAGDGMDTRVIAIGKTFGCIKLLDDAPHWSEDGH